MVRMDLSLIGISGGRSLDEQLRLMCVMAHPDDESLELGQRWRGIEPKVWRSTW